MTEPANTAPAGTGLAPNLAAALSYVLGLITGVIFFVLEKDSPYVRFHAMQSILVSVVLIVLQIVLGMVGVVPVIGWLFAILGGMVLGIVALILWLVLMFKAFNGQEWEVPVIGKYARQYANSGNV
jgi:uncharacterized membrane protein